MSSLFWEENREDKGEGLRSHAQHRDRFVNYDAGWLVEILAGVNISNGNFLEITGYFMKKSGNCSI